MDRVVLLGRIPFTRPESNDLGFVWIEPLADVSATSGQTSVGRNPDRRRFLRVVEFGCLRVVNQMSYLTVGSLENTSRLVDVSLNWTINSTG